VNDVPHIGHAYTTIAADVMARYKKLCGQKVFFLTGTDEHGQKIERTAKQAGKTPTQLADEVVVRFKDLWKVLNISNDDFIRTTERRHKIAVNEIFKTIAAKGDIYLGEYEGWYDVRDEAYITDTQYEEFMELSESKRPIIERVKEKSYFFKLSEYQQRLLDHYKKYPDFIKPENRRNEVISFVEGGLRDLSISRTSFSWGVPIESDDEHVIYVWFDALTNYLTAIGYPDNKEMLNEYWPCDFHFVGKDILRFHAVYWPAFLMSAGLQLPRTVFAHGKCLNRLAMLSIPTNLPTNLEWMFLDIFC
jgi:methionyl-tRNA synthetase